MKQVGSTLLGALSNLLAQGVPFLLLLVVTPVLIRALGRETYGALILFNLLPQMAGQLDLGLITAATRAYAQYIARNRRDDAHRVVTETIVILGLWGSLLAIGLVSWRHAIATALQLDGVIHGQTLIFAVAAIGIPIALLNLVAMIPLRALEQYGRAARVQIAAGVAYWIGCTLAATRGATLFDLVCFAVAVASITNIVLFMMLWRARRDVAKAPAIPVLDIPLTREALAVDKSSLRLRPFLPLGAGAFVAQASSLATYHTDKLLVSAVVSPAAAGAYAICANIANKILLVVASGATYTFPRAARLHAQGDHDSLVRTFVVTTRFALMIATAFATPLIALAKPFLRVWIGNDFALHYAPVMQLLAVGYAVNAASVVASNVAIGMGEVKLPAIFALAGGTTTIVAVVVLAPVFGAPGAAAASLLGMSQAILFSNMIASKLGREAGSASWSVQIELVLVAVPVAAATFLFGTAITGWFGLLATGIASAAVFLLIWLSTFGRHSERIVIEALVARMRPGITETA